MTRFRPTLEALEDRWAPAGLNLQQFSDPGDIIGTARLEKGDSPKLVLVNSDTSAGDAVLVLDPITGTEVARYPHSERNFIGWLDPEDRTLFGDVDGDGVDEMIQFNRHGPTPSGVVFRVLEVATGFIQSVFGYEQLQAGSLFEQFLDPEDAVLVGHFTQTSHLEALFFNRTSVDSSLLIAPCGGAPDCELQHFSFVTANPALRVLDLVTGTSTFSSHHNGRIFAGWTDPTDEALVSDWNDDGFDDLVLVNRTAGSIRGTNRGFIGVVSIHDTPENSPDILFSTLEGRSRGFYRFFTCESSALQGFEQIGDRIAAGTVVNNGQRTPVLLLVNSNPDGNTDEAAYALLESRPIDSEHPDGFQFISTISRSIVPPGAFNGDDEFLMADFDGDGTDEVGAFSRSGLIQFRTLGPFTGATGNVVPRIPLDPTFGNEGRVATRVTNSEYTEGRAIAVQADGKIIVGGVAQSPSDHTQLSVLARYHPDGALDNTFGTNGVVTFRPITASRYDGDLKAIALQSDGKIITIGGGSEFVINRLNPDGSLDVDFGVGGTVTVGFPELVAPVTPPVCAPESLCVMPSESDSVYAAANAVAVQADGRIVVAGSVSIRKAYSLFCYRGDADIVLVRVNPNGSLDVSFGTGGKVINDFAVIPVSASSIGIQPDGKIVLAGSSYTGPVRCEYGIIPALLPFDFAHTLVRFETNGVLDGSFGDGGRVVSEATGSGYELSPATIALRDDDKIVVVGGVTLARYNSDGTLDQDFGVGGRVATGIPYPGFGRSETAARDVAIQEDGKIVVLSRGFEVLRYQADGTLDMSFGEGGIAAIEFDSGGGLAAALSLQPDGKIVVAGGLGSFALARLLA